ncbi:hypothetical protein M8J77_008501 [Diaphorina citri]|nr:hypothetical protein M8J77_008501 [Diaphorina citri]
MTCNTILVFQIEELQRVHDAHSMHKKIKELTGGRRQKAHFLINEEGKIIIDMKEKLKQWENYIQKLFDDEREPPNDMEEDNGPDILKDEVKYAIKTIKAGKALGPDELPGDVLKLIEEEHLGTLTLLLNQIYKTGIIPREWLKSTFITLPKKTNAKKCEEYRTISLMSHTLKIFLKIIHRRIYRKLEDNISNTQFGFRNGFGTREALFAFNVIMQRCLDVNQNIHICFLDYNKAFDRVQHNQLMDTLEEEGLDSRDIREASKSTV